MKRFLLLTMLLLGGCGTGVSYSHHQNGLDVYTAKCNGTMRDISSCYRQASEQCGGNFHVINANENIVGSTSNNNSFGNMNLNTDGQADIYKNNMNWRSSTSGNMYTNSTGSTMNIINRSIMFYCKENG